MDKIEYLQTVTNQVRYQKAREMISDELDCHIEDQKDAYMAEGMEENEACEKAVLEMGDPVEVGIEMDRIHRPKMEWRMVFLALFLGFLGIGVQFIMHLATQYDVYTFPLDRRLLQLAIGFGVMIVFCRIDYTKIGQYAKVGAIVILGLIVLTMMREVVIDDHSFYLKFRPDRIPFQPLLLLYVPFFGGILYRYKDKGKSGFVKCILWMFVPVLLSFLLNEFLLSSALLAIMLVQFCYVIRKGWFTPIHKRFCFLMSSLAGYLITAILYFDYFSKMHHEFRILSFYLGTHGYQERDKVRELLLGSTLLGENTTGSFFGVGAEPSNYIMTFLISNFGVIVAGLLLLILSYFTYKLFRISFKQKNQLGLIIGLGCSLVFAVQIGMYVLSNLSFLPSMPGYLPLFSPGSIGTIVTYGLLGILLSIYRYKDVTPESPVITSRFKPFNRIVQKRLEGTVPCATIEQK